MFAVFCSSGLSLDKEHCFLKQKTLATIGFTRALLQANMGAQTPGLLIANFVSGVFSELFIIVIHT